MNIRKSTLNHLGALLKQFREDRAYSDRMIDGVMNLISLAEKDTGEKTTKAPTPAGGKPKRFNKGSLREAIMTATADFPGGEDFGGREIQARLSPKLQKKFDHNQVNTALGQMARGAGSPVVRVSLGRYKLA